jgi:hypothetical protein
MSRILTGVLVWSVLAHVACSHCSGPENVVDALTEDTFEETSSDPETDPSPLRLPKHDWNGVTVMMRESEVSEALWAIGFSLTPSRQDTFPVLTGEGHDVRLVPLQGFSPPLVAFETEKNDSPLGSVYGLRLYFHRNRLFCFQPVYYADPVDLVDPGDEAIPPGVMSTRLGSTFGEPKYSGTGKVQQVSDQTTIDRQVTVWADEDLVVLFSRPIEGTLPAYDLQFFSPQANLTVAALVDLLMKPAP